MAAPRARRLLAVAALAVLTAASATACLSEEEIDAQVHLNQIQVMGTHNSYHEVSTVPERSLRRSILGAAVENEFTYTHRPLDVQFQSERIRQIEAKALLKLRCPRRAAEVLRAWDEAPGAFERGAADPADLD